MFKLSISDTVLFDVRGSLKDDRGVEIPFDFQLECKRDESDSLQDTLREDSGVLIPDYMRERVVGWKKVADPMGAPVAFSAEGLAQLFRVAGMARLCFLAYLEAVGVKGKAKN